MVLLNIRLGLFCFTLLHTIFNRYFFLSINIEFTTNKLLFTKIPQLWYCAVRITAVN